MAGKSNGFKTFFLLVVCLVLAVFFGLAAALILIPGFEVFGLKYKNATFSTAIERIEIDDVDMFLDYKKFDKMVINVENCAVHINSGIRNAPSSLKIKFQSNGFYKSDMEWKDYNYNFYADDTTLFLYVTEPSYNVWEMSNSSRIDVNIAEEITCMDFHITTTGGDVFVGGTTDMSTTAEVIPMENFYVNTKSGTVKVSDTTSISNKIDVVTENGNIVINNDLTCPIVNLSSEKGKIQTQNISNTNGVVNIAGNDGGIMLQDISADVNCTMQSGYVKIGKLIGNFTANSDMKFTNIEIKELLGDFTAVNDEDGNFRVNLMKNTGQVNIIGANKGVILSNVCDAENSAINIRTAGGSVEFVLDNNHDDSVNIQTESGAIKGTFNIVYGINNLITKTGKITVNCENSTPFYLNAKTQGVINKVWLGESVKNTQIENEAIGEAPSSNNKLNLQSENGEIKVDLF